MGYQERTVGGGPATGLADNFVNFLNKAITTGSFGSGTAGQQFNAENPSGDAAGIFGLLNSLISNPQADKSVQDMISKDIVRGRDDLRARFGASGGMGYGTPAAVAEGVYQAEQAPRTAIAMDSMAQNRLASLMPLFGMINQLSSMGIPQAQATLEPSGWMQGLNIAMDLANTAANFIPGGGGSETNSRRKPDTETANRSPIGSGMAFRFNPLPTQQVYT